MIKFITSLLGHLVIGVCHFVSSWSLNMVWIFQSFVYSSRCDSKRNILHHCNHCHSHHTALLAQTKMCLCIEVKTAINLCNYFCVFNILLAIASAIDAFAIKSGVNFMIPLGIWLVVSVLGYPILACRAWTTREHDQLLPNPGGTGHYHLSSWSCGNECGWHVGRWLLVSVASIASLLFATNVITKSSS